VVWKLQSDTPESASRLAHGIFVACAARDLHLALVELPLTWFGSPAGSQPVRHKTTKSEMETITCLRSVLMKAEHAEWMNIIWEKLTAACAEVMGE
jgi:hypothetical protein